jgi:hypothetical protein
MSATNQRSQAEAPTSLTIRNWVRPKAPRFFGLATAKISGSSPVRLLKLRSLTNKEMISLGRHIPLRPRRIKMAQLQNISATFGKHAARRTNCMAIASTTSFGIGRRFRTGSTACQAEIVSHALPSRPRNCLHCVWTPSTAARARHTACPESLQCWQ